MFTHIAFSQHLISHPRLCFPASFSLGFREFPVRVKGFRREAVHFDTFLKKGSFCSDMLVGRRRRGGSGSWCCRGKGFEESEGEAILEAEILEFMNKSEKPVAFPTKEELLKGGRMDLVEAIVRKGGWLSMGWDLDDDVDEKKGFSGDYSETADFSIEDFQERVDSLQESSSFKDPEAESLHSSPMASPSGRSLDMAVEDISGIDGILNRLEKERNVALGINFGSNGHTRNASNENDRDHTHIQNLADANRAALRENRTPPTEMWRTWCSQRAGFTNTEFEAAEIYYDQDTTGWAIGSSHDDRKFTKGASEAVDAADILNEINSNQIQTRLQQLELELASTLHSLWRSTSKEALPKGHESSSSELQKLSDEWEFQENEVINAKDKLRSIRAKLAILEGKMALAIIQSQMILEDKQVRIAGARRSLQLLQTCCIVWPNTASEVLLTGSFDGWTTQRKMEKSKTGIFSVCLGLYPGRYEIKFIVDGVWKIDPLRPIVHNSGYENNLLTIT